MDDSDPSKELSDFLNRLPAARAVGIADPDVAEPDAIDPDAIDPDAIDPDAIDPAASDLGAAEQDRLPASPDPERDGPAAGEIVLAVGIEPAAAAGLLTAAARAGSAAVVLRAPAPASTVGLAARLGLELHQLPRSISWHELHRQLLRRLKPAIVHADDGLAELAQTIATLTGGLVTIEDSTSARVLAYSRSSDEVDELRRLSILGRSGPADYLALLRQWGIYHRLAESEEVVEIAEHPASGVRRRLAVGVFAGNRQLGTIWVQQGAADFEPHAKQALLGAARLTAQHLVGSAGQRDPATDLAALLGWPATGTTGDRPAELAAAVGLGRLANRPCAVAVFVAGPAVTDPAAAHRRLDDLATIVRLHAAAFRRHALAGQLAGRVYLLLPNLSQPGPAVAMLTDTVTAVRRHLDPAARASLGRIVGSVAEAARSRTSAEQALRAASAEPVLTFAAARPGLVATLLENCLSQQPELLDERLGELIDSDPASARTLLAILDTGSDVARVAAEHNVHPTTVRYRLRRALAAVELDLTDPDIRLASQVQLRCGLRTRDKER